jgi:hypothetical protein
MYPDGMFALLKEVILSWQVIAITVALVIYLNIVFYTARSYRRPRMIKKAKPNSKKAKSEPAAETGPEEAGSDLNSTDELGLEEE